MTKTQTETAVPETTVRFVKLVEFMIRWIDGARVSPLMAERFTRRCDTLAKMTETNARRMRRMVREAAERVIVDRAAKQS